MISEYLRYSYLMKVTRLRETEDNALSSHVSASGQKIT